MVKRNNLLGTIGYSFIILALVSVLWYLIAFSLAFAPTAGGSHFIGNMHYACLNNIYNDPNPVYSATIPLVLYFFF